MSDNSIQSDGALPEAFEASGEAARLGNARRRPLRRKRHGPFRDASLPFLLGWGGNRFEAVDWRGRFAGLRLFLRPGARGNSISIGRNFRCRHFSATFAGTGNRLEIGDDVVWNCEIDIRGSNVAVRIGDRCDAKQGRLVAVGASITIGPDCLIADGVEFRSSDIHRIVDRATGEVVNAACPIEVGQRVWIASGAMIAKGVRIAAGCVIGARAVVTRSVDEPNVVAAGSPAQIVRRGVGWKR